MILTFSILLISGCAARQMQMERTSFVPGVGTAAIAAPVLPGSTAKAQEAENNRIMVKRAGITLAVDDSQKAAETVTNIARDAGGYMENEQQNDDTYNITLKVPPDKLESTVDKICAIGGEKSRNVSKEDVTAQVIDSEAVIKNKKALRDRLRKLADHASDIKDIMDIESELARVQAEIDSMESWLKNLKNQAAMAEISVEISKKATPGPLGWFFMGLGWLIEKLFVW